MRQVVWVWTWAWVTVLWSSVGQSHNSHNFSLPMRINENLSQDSMPWTRAFWPHGCPHICGVTCVTLNTVMWLVSYVSHGASWCSSCCRAKPKLDIKSFVVVSAHSSVISLSSQLNNFLWLFFIIIAYCFIYCIKSPHSAHSGQPLFKISWLKA